MTKSLSTCIALLLSTLSVFTAHAQGEGPARPLVEVVRPFFRNEPARHRLAFERYGKTPALQSRQTKALEAQRIDLVEHGQTQGYAPTVLFVQKADEKLAARVAELSRKGSVVVAAVSPAAFGEGEAQGKMLRDLFAAKARRVIFWDDDKSPSALKEALFDRASVGDNRDVGATIAAARPWASIANSSRWQRVLDQLDHAIDSRARVVVLSGEAHSGKEALMEAFFQRHANKLSATTRFSESALVPGTEEQLLAIAPRTSGFLEGADLEWRQNNTLGGKGQGVPHLGFDEVARLGEKGQRHLAWLAGRARGSVVLTLDAPGGDVAKAIEGLTEPLKKLIKERGTHVIRVPGLSERKDDIPHLATWFYSRRLYERWTSATSNLDTAQFQSLDEVGLDSVAAGLLREMEYPHGIRSLRSMMEAVADRVPDPARERPDITFDSIAPAVGGDIED